MQKLLVADPLKRLGVHTVRGEAFLRQLDFERLERKEYSAPWVPKLQSPTDSTYCAQGLHAHDEDDNKMNGPITDFPVGFWKENRRQARYPSPAPEQAPLL